MTAGRGGALLVAAACVLAAFVVLASRPAARGRLTRLTRRSGRPWPADVPARARPADVPARARPGDVPARARPGDGQPDGWSGGGRLGRVLGDPRRPLAAAVAVAVALVVGGWPGLVVGALSGLVADRALRRLEPPHVRAERAACVEDLPLAADLLAAALRSGAPVDRAVAAVAAALDGPLGERLARTARSLRLGAEPAEAWEHLAGVPAAGRLVMAAVRSNASGAALAAALTRLADDLRADRAVTAEAAARRAGVLVVLPLGLCFLPAFVLAGLAPVLVAVLGDAF